MVILQKQKLLPFFFILTIILGVTLLFNLSSDDASGLSRACQNSQACIDAAKKQEEANRNAANASLNANAYEIRVRELTSEIASKEAEIAETTAEVEELNQKIAETEAKLKMQQSALAKLIVEMHFDTTEDAISILASSESISDLAEKQSREEAVQNQIAATANAVKEMKAALEEDKAGVEALLAQQKLAKADLDKARSEQQALVDKYKNDAAAYAAAAKKAKEEQEAAEKAEQEAHPELYRGSSFYGDNTYPWQNDCPGRKDDYVSYWNGYKIGGYVCECVSYAGWKMYEFSGYPLAWGNAYSWDDRAKGNSSSDYSKYFYVDKNPAANSIGQTDSGKWGHVFWVESVNSDGSINVTEYNNSYATKLYSGNSHSGDFGARKISASDAKSFNYIHLK